MPDTNQYHEGSAGHLIPIGAFEFHPGANGALKNGASLIPEEYARLHADIERAASPARCFVVGVTSAVYGEGKTTVALNLAGTMAQNSEARVSLVDFNLRNWDMQTRLNMHSVPGLVDVLEGSEDDMSNIIQRTELDNLTIIPAGRAAANPARLVRSPRLTEVISALKLSNDFIVMDMAPVLPVADTKILARLLDGVVMVVRAGVTPREIVQRAIDAVGSDKVLGVVLNGVETAMPRWLQRYFS
ncbi:MAG TPA: CpsD/CapB family tyrosine-protein kinase [Chthonomonadales bacterium]|nr:CpsD/CapB family tyrosine-protein kinase [Chthonomonadales bacterium]